MPKKAPNPLKQAANPTNQFVPSRRRPHNRRPVELEIALKEAAEDDGESCPLPRKDDGGDNCGETTATETTATPVGSAPPSDCDSDSDDADENNTTSSYKTPPRKKKNATSKHQRPLLDSECENPSSKKKKTFYELKAERKTLFWKLDADASTKPKHGGKANLHHCPKSFKGNCRRAKTPNQRRPYCKTHQVYCDRYGTCNGGAEWPRLPNQSCGRCGGW